MRLVLFVIVLALSPIVLNAQTLPEWLRVYTFDDSTVEMNTLVITPIAINVTRVRFRWTFREPQSLDGTPELKYQSELEVVELDCSNKIYRPFHFTYFDAAGNILRTIDSPGEWQKVKPGRMIEKLFVPACDLIRKKTQPPPVANEEEERLKKVAQFALDVAQYQEKEKDFKALTDRFFVPNYLDRYLHDQRTNWFLNLNRDTAAKLSREELQRFYLALMNAGYLSSLYLISQIPIDAEDPGPVEKLLPPDVLQLVRNHPYTAQYKTIAGDPDFFGENLDSVERVRTYTDLLEKINALLHEHVKTVKASDSNEWKDMIEHWNLFQPKARVCAVNCLELPAGTTIFEVNVPVFTLQVAEVNGNLKVISAKSGF